ncbi:hypothetical protein J437_LFUL017284 [Ladona fulva]|uniref:PI3K/PI4K catalytic domain-containing protein n=1 Tax=Ladona fulva TaxID=123851 RepID=A0A8K0P8A3_LADFU|nr:hypothetical protein J437_LFUL017284 [Ladona fulva]
MFDSSSSENGDTHDVEVEEEEEEEKVVENEESKTVERDEVDDDDDEEEEEEEDDDDEEESSVGEVQASVMRNCFQSIVDTLAKKNPECVAGVQTLVKELRRTTLLWDEAWSGLLAQQSTEAARRCNQAEAEAARTYANAGITDPALREKIVLEKHRIIVAPVLWALEQLYSLTCTVPPETPHERRFRERHGPLLTELLSRMRQPPDPRHPNESWMSLYIRIQASLRGGSSSGPPSLRMSEVSPVLAAMHGTAVAMPGANTSTENVVMIEAVNDHITILPTKTRPKKLVFHGSNGQKYTYLFKGLEDLHLDERIMQFLSVANTMMARASRTGSNLGTFGKGSSGWKSRGSLYKARHYSVTPLGPRAGLISWVEGATPLFGLYKRWQHRQAAAAAAAAAAMAAKPSGTQSTSGSASSSSSKGSATGGPTGILRPSELFHSKLAPLLKERGIPVPVAPGPHGGGGYVPADGRRDWPPQVLRQVLIQLMEETPKDLLAKELWCRSANASSWWQTTRTYAHSVAVMSIIGYVIGLGDRHLDNVLVDLETGEVVHIDYNVCFEKGRTLRVPEKVPFRMTPNLETALGVTGVEVSVLC